MLSITVCASCFSKLSFGVRCFVFPTFSPVFNEECFEWLKTLISFSSGASSECYEGTFFMSYHEFRAASFVRHQVSLVSFRLKTSFFKLASQWLETSIITFMVESSEFSEGLFSGGIANFVQRNWVLFGLSSVGSALIKNICLDFFMCF